jgi:Ca-activated chloride channel family protein
MTRNLISIDDNLTISDSQVDVALEMRPERRLIRQGSHRHVDFQVRVSGGAPVARPPLAIALVLDRSGSMHGDKIDTARRAALAVLERLEDSDRVAAVVFDDRIDVLQSGASATREVKARLRAELGTVQARGSTALHEGWLTGCRVIAPDTTTGTVTRCFLLTDGLANVGLTDAEQIASEAAGVREHAGVGTSTFGIGGDYDESLLGPLAVAGGGQFHHLRTPDEIARTFLGELGELLAVSASNVRLEIKATPGTGAEVVSLYWSQATRASSWTISLGDLLASEERHVLVRFEFSGSEPDAAHVVQARLVWVGVDGAEGSTPWQEIAFEYADTAARGAESADPSVLRIVGQQHAERARRDAVARSRAGDVNGARHLLRRVARRIDEYAGTDAVLRSALADLNAAEHDLEQHGYQAAAGKEAYFMAQARGRGQRDLREQ